MNAAPTVPAQADAATSMARRVWVLAIPAVGESLLGTLMYLVDTLMVAPLGSATIAAAGLSSVILWRVFMTAGCVERGATAMVARYTGEGDADKAALAVGQAIGVALAIGVAVTVATILLAGRFLAWMGGEPDVVAVGAPFLVAVFASAAARLLFMVAAGCLRGAGDTRSPMWIMVWSNVLNLGLNYVLIFGHFGCPKLGLLGSGISTSIAGFYAAAAAVQALRRRGTGIGRRCGAGLQPARRELRGSGLGLQRRHFAPNMPAIRTLLRLSGPAFADEITVSVGFLTFSFFIAKLGTVALAAHTLASRIESVSYMAGFGFSVAAATLVGQSLGAGNEAQARQAFRRSTASCVGVMSAVAAALILGGRWMVAAFQPEEAVGHLAVGLLVIAAVEQPLMGVAFTLGGGLRGAGDTVSPMVVSLVSNFGIRIVAAWWLGFGLGWGIVGIYLCTVLDWAVRATMLYVAFAHGRWKTVVM